MLMRELRIDFATAEWITMVFLLLVSGLLLSFGRLGDMVGHKRVALAGFGLFILGSG
ncbi:MAG TPA: MFS transporter, partial [Myxococcales bacterium]|nr:MFS transporter [Myxococcales bacterium]